ncbi:YitT family protein [Fredinandcohnia humi]
MRNKIVAILLGSILLSIGINFFLVPYKILDGGIIGLGLIVNYITGLKAGLAIILLSIPVFVIAWVYNKSYFFNSIHGMLFSSFIIDLLASQANLFSHFYLNPIPSSVIGGIFVGLGIGIMLRHETSTGGTDLLAQFLTTFFKMNVGVIIFLIDAIVICLGGLLISKETFLLSLLAITFVGLSTTISTWDLPGSKGNPL